MEPVQYTTSITEGQASTGISYILDENLDPIIMKEKIITMDVKLAIDYEDKLHTHYAVIMN